VINFKLKDLNQINPVGQEPNLYLSWFWLTDGDLWLTFGNQTIYKYSKEALAHFEDKVSPYNDYYLVRFLEDFSDLFEMISEEVPSKLFNLTGDLSLFLSNAQKWLDIYETDEEEFSDFYFEEYDQFISWVSERTLGSSHLIGGPTLSFFKNDKKIRIIWDTEKKLENGIYIWEAKNGIYEMDFVDFVDKIESFGVQFFKDMDRQIELTIEKNWENIKIDKNRIKEEQKERQEDFFIKLNLLKQKTTTKTNWEKIEQLYNRMTKEIN
jgi:hypothetical protein